MRCIGKGRSLKEKQSWADEEQESPYISRTRMWAPQRHKPWPCHLWICHSTQHKDALNKATITWMILFFSRWPSFPFVWINVHLHRESMGLEARQTNGGILASLSLSLWLWSKSFTFLCLSFPICRIGRIKPISWGCYKRVKQYSACKAFRTVPGT